MTSAAWRIGTVCTLFCIMNMAWSQAIDTKASEEVGVTVFRTVAPSVLMVRSTRGSTQVQGSGVAFKHGYGQDRKPNQSWVITNAHVVSGSSTVKVVSGPSSYAAKVEYVDNEIDLALLNVSDAVFPVATFLKSGTPPIGDRVFAIGSPLGLENSISEGIISGKRVINGASVIQTTAPISKGNSGGGLFDSKSRLIGITTFKLSTGESLNFAIDADYVNTLMDAQTAAKSLQILSEFLAHPAIWDQYPDRLVRWLMTKKSRDGDLMYRYFLRKQNEGFQLKDIHKLPEFMMKIHDEIVDQFVEDPGGDTKNNSQTQAVTEVKPLKYRLSCPMYSDEGVFQFELPLTIDPASSMVNGRRASFTDDQITFQIGSGATHYGRLNRYTGIVVAGPENAPTLLQGKCAKLGERQF